MNALFEAIGEFLKAVIQLVIQIIFETVCVEVGRAVIYACSGGRLKIDETSGFQSLIAGVVGFIFVGVALTLPFWFT